MKKLKAEIDEERRRIESATGSSHTQKLDELREAELDAQKKKLQLDEIDRQPLERTKAEANEKLRTAKQALEPAQKRVESHGEPAFFVAEKQG